MSTDRRTRAWIEVQAAAVRRNLRRVRDAVGERAALIPMVKADGYGLGLERVVHALEPTAPWGYGVATVEEGRRIRELGVDRTVLVCSPLPPGSYGEAVSFGLTPCLSDYLGLRLLEEAATAAGRTAEFHVEVDTGMGRAGFDWRAASEWGPVFTARHGHHVRWAGCFTHFHSADGSDPSSIRVQWERFRSALGTAQPPQEGFLIHAANSAAALRAGAEIEFGGARPGILLYGGSAGVGLPGPEAVASLRARVVHVREAAPGSTLGYGATYASTEWERWATLGIGYGDGLPRSLGNRGEALIKGKRVPIVGRVSMDLTVVNISGLEGVEVGDVATLVGEDGGERITVDEVAELAGTISYEILTGLTGRLPRVWIDDGGD
jgi:alanine racemase